MTSTLLPIVGTGPIAGWALHGFTQTGGMWEEVAETAHVGLVVPDLPGHGERWPAATHWHNVVDWVVASLGAKRTTLIGYSQGGRVALAAALAAPHLVERLVLVSARPGLPDPVARAERAAADLRLAAEIESSDQETFIEGWLARPMFSGLASRDAQWRERDRMRRMVHQPAGLAAALRGYGLGAMPYLGGRLGELTMPVVCIAGSLDVEYASIAREMAAAAPQGSVVLIEDAGHNVVAERPAETAAAMFD